MNGQSFSLLMILWSLQPSALWLDSWHSATSTTCGWNHQDNSLSAYNRWKLILSTIQAVSHPWSMKYCPTQLSTLEFSPWILTAFIHCVPIAYFTYRWNTCHLISQNLPKPPHPSNASLTWECGHWTLVALLWTLALTPQFIVLAALVRVHRFDPNKAFTYIL